MNAVLSCETRSMHTCQYTPAKSGLWKHVKLGSNIPHKSLSHQSELASLVRDQKV